MTEDDLKEFKVIEFIEVEPDKLVWDDTGTGTWMSGPPVCIFDQNFFDSGPNVSREIRPVKLLGIVHYFLITLF